MLDAQGWVIGRKHGTLSVEHRLLGIDKILAMRKLLILLAVLLTAQSVYAQGAYVSASLTGDVVRQNRVKSAGTDQSTDGEAIGFALRVGTELGTRWGVELEFARPQKIDNEFSPGIVPLPADVTPLNIPGVGAPTISGLYTFPTYSYRLRTSRRNTMLSSAVWARQQLSPRMSLVYLGGIGFHRTSSDVTLTFEPRAPIGFPIALPPSVTSSINYDAGPFAGMDGRIGLTDHAHIVAGVRLHGINGGWLFRPSVGIGWNF